MKTAEDEVAAEKAAQKELQKHRGENIGEGRQIQRLQVKSFGELISLADMLAKSDIVPKDMVGKPANVLLALMFGNELGVTPAQALQNVMIVNGRPALWGDLVMGLVENSNLQEMWKDEFMEGFEGGAVKFTTKRKGRDPVVRIFSMADAKLAKLTEKDGPWKQYPKRMLFHRARSWALRDAYPDVLKGVRYYEEEKDFIDTTATRDAGGEKVYEVPKEKVPGAPAAAAPAPAPAAPSAAAPNDPEGKEEVFRVTGGATSPEFDGECYVVRDDCDPPNKYFHSNPEWHEKAKAAKDAKTYITVRWVDKKGQKGPVRWLTSFSLKS
jgi:hypothetical protein